MRRVNVHLEEDLDAELAAEASRRGQSKAALLREAARSLLDQQAIATDGGWEVFTGAVTDSGPDDRHHDEVIYGR